MNGEPKRGIVLPMLAPYLSKRQTLIIFAVVVAALFLLAYRSEVAINTTDMTQRVACESGLEILVKFNAQQDTLIEIERANAGVEPEIRAARIEAYKAGRIDPLPICEAVPAK